MSKLYKAAAFLFFVFISLSFSADDELKVLFTIKSNADFFTTDNLGNTYLIKGEEVKKYSQTGDLLKIFSNKIRFSKVSKLNKQIDLQYEP